MMFNFLNSILQGIGIGIGLLIAYVITDRLGKYLGR